MPTEIDDCPCSGKSMSSLTAPWILLTLWHHKGIHGYEIQRIIKGHLEGFPVGLNITGLYRHLKLLEQRGMLSSRWDTTGKGPARRKYSLTRAGTECLWRWMNTLCTQASIIGCFFQHARSAFPTAPLPRVEFDADTEHGPKNS